MLQYKYFIGKSEGKRALQISGSRGQNNKERESKCAHWILLVQDRAQRRTLINTVTNLRVP
jgi:hypothetical protein